MILAELTLDAALAATATSSRRFAGGRAGALAGAPPPPRAGLDDLVAHVRRRLRCAVAGRGRRLVGPRPSALFYLFGAILNVPWLALGTVYLLAGRRLADGVRWGLVVASGFAAGVMVTAPLHATVPADELPEGRDLFASAPRTLAAVGSGVAAVVVIGGAVVGTGGCGSRGARAGSCAPTCRRRLALGNVIIAVGTLVLSASGTLARPAGQGHGVRAHARDRRRHPLLRLPRRHARAREPRRRLPHRHRPAAKRSEALG